MTTTPVSSGADLDRLAFREKEMANNYSGLSIQDIPLAFTSWVGDGYPGLDK